MAFSLNDGGYETSMIVMMVTKKFYPKKVQVVEIYLVAKVFKSKE